ncbi:IclR family transcriptional regulator [Bacillus sp. Marseille-P3661]|uniref:IclR family transcriptional regulator n=1 Tax=Bacillus sp. Marseille-P3661 TaxID=1936234 RepID=UPI0015E18BD8|nr:IclR family transcriptional regulator [Bacillus sp. Marseille-P3661]
MRDVNIGSIRSIDRAIDILQAFSIEDPSLSIDRIVKKTKIPNSTVYRILCTLERRGLVQFDESSATYKPGLRLMEFGVLLSSVLDIRKEAEEILIDLHLKTNQTILMAIKEGDELLHIYKKENYQGLKVSTTVGQRRPYNFGAMGPVLLAFQPEEEIERILKIPIPRYTPNTITDINKIRERLNQIKNDKFYISSNETNLGVTGIGAPVFGMGGEIEATIGIVGPQIQVDDKLEEFTALILDAAKQISAKIGFRGTF